MNTNSDTSLFERALQFEQSGDLNSAIIYYKEASETEGFELKANANLANLFLNKGDLAQASVYWQKALEYDQDHFDSLANLGYVLCNLGDLNNAIPYLEKAHKIEPGRDDVAMQLAQVRSSQGMFKEAEVYLIPYIKEKTPNENVYLLLSQVRTLNNDLDGAEEVLLSLLEMKPQVPEALINLGQIHESKGSLTEAKHYYSEAATKVPFNFLANREYGRFLGDFGDVNESLEFLEKAKQLNSQDWGLYVHFGNVYQRLGEFDKAIKAYKKSLSINSNDLGVQQNLSRVLTRFVPPWHLKMLADHERNNAFQKAIEKAVDEKSVVLDIGTGSGILSMMAARAGAQKVYTCEQSTYIAEAALENISKNGYESQIKLFPKKSTQMAESDFSDKSNLIVAEIFDAGLLGEHAIPSFRHALNQLSSPNTQVIPRSADVRGKLIHSEKLASVNPIREISGLDLSAFDQFRVAEEYMTQNLAEISHEFCSEEFDMLTVDFTNPWEAFAPGQYRWFDLKIEITSDLPIHGVAFWFNLHLDDEISLSSEPGRKDNHWGQALSCFQQSIQSKAGGFLKIPLCYNDIKIWFGEPVLIND